MKNKAYVLNIIFGVTVQAISQSGAKAELRQAQKNLKDFIDKVNTEEGETVIRRDEGKEKVYEGEVVNNQSIDNSEKNGIMETEVKQEMNLVIDKFTPCLEDTETGELVPTVYEKAAKISYDKGYGGFLFMDAKNTELAEHYRNTLGAVLIGRPHPFRMFVDEENAIKLLNTYTFEEG